MKIESGKQSLYNEGSTFGFVLIDAQDSILAKIQKKGSFLQSIIIVIQASRIFNLPLLVTEQVPHKLGKTSKSLLPYLEGINRFAKSTFSIFGSSKFVAHLETLKIRHLILLGVETPICVYLSAIEALKAGYEVTILSDCVGARRRNDEEVALFKLERAGCHIIPLESFLYGYLKTSEHPHFREISKLISDRSISG